MDDRSYTPCPNHMLPADSPVVSAFLAAVQALTTNDLDSLPTSLLLPVPWELINKLTVNVYITPVFHPNNNEAPLYIGNLLNIDLTEMYMAEELCTMFKGMCGCMTGMVQYAIREDTNQIQIIIMNVEPFEVCLKGEMPVSEEETEAEAGY